MQRFVLVSICYRSVTVGDPLYHRWTCASTGNLYCIMVHSCTLGHNESKSRGKKVEIIDEFGCSVYPELVPNMNYIGDTEAGFKANAFLIDIDQVLILFLLLTNVTKNFSHKNKTPSCSRVFEKTKIV